MTSLNTDPFISIKENNGIKNEIVSKISYYEKNNIKIWGIAMGTKEYFQLCYSLNTNSVSQFYVKKVIVKCDPGVSYILSDNSDAISIRGAR